MCVTGDTDIGVDEKGVSSVLCCFDGMNGSADESRARFLLLLATSGAGSDRRRENSCDGIVVEKESSRADGVTADISVFLSIRVTMLLKWNAYFA